MNQYILFFCSVIIFFTLFYLLNEKKVEPLTTVLSNVDPQSNLVDSVYLKERHDKLLELQKKLSDIRDVLYKKKESDILTINVKQKTHDDKKPDHFEATIEKLDDFSNILHINNPIGSIGVAGQPGKKGPTGDEGDEGDRGEVGHCGGII